MKVVVISNKSKNRKLFKSRWWVTFIHSTLVPLPVLDTGYKVDTRTDTTQLSYAKFPVGNATVSKFNNSH